MRCRTCDYPLWNLTARNCPECGTAFKPSDFHFLHNAVRFCCPHCDQSYYGTGEHGHLVPSEFNCVSCGQRIAMDLCVLQPAAGVKEEQAQTDIMPWLERKRRGWFSGLFRTIGMAMVGPHKLIRATPPTGSMGDAWLFAFVTASLIYALGVALPLAVIGGFILARGDPDGMSMLIASAIITVGGGVITLISAWMWAVVTHGLLRISGRCEHGLSRTLQAILYSSGTNAPLGVPCVGMYCGGWVLWIWWLVSAIVMIVHGQRVSGLRATLCTMAFPLVVVFSVFAGYFGLIYFALSQSRVMSMQAQMSMGGYQPTAEASTVATALADYAAANNGAFPAHGLQLMTDGTLAASDFVVWQTGHDEANVPVGSSTLSAIQMLGPNRARQAARDAAATLPTNVIAHRLGDVVFTYHGVSINNADPQLWIAIIDGDPDQANVTTGVITPVAVGADGSLTPLPAAIFGTMLQQQNAVRAQNGLVPLPHPSTITHANPAFAAAAGRGGP